MAVDENGYYYQTPEENARNNPFHGMVAQGDGSYGGGGGYYASMGNPDPQAGAKFAAGQGERTMNSLAEAGVPVASAALLTLNPNAAGEVLRGAAEQGRDTNNAFMQRQSLAEHGRQFDAGLNEKASEFDATQRQQAYQFDQSQKYDEARTMYTAQQQQASQQAQQEAAAKLSQQRSNEQRGLFEYEFSAQQQNKIAEYNQARDTVNQQLATNAINQDQHADLMRQIDFAQAHITPHPIPKKRDPFPPGQGMGDSWVHEGTGALVGRNKDGEVHVLVTPDKMPQGITQKIEQQYKAADEKRQQQIELKERDFKHALELHDTKSKADAEYRDYSAVLKLATENRKADKDAHRGPDDLDWKAPPLSDYIKDAEASVADWHKRRQPSQQADPAAPAKPTYGDFMRRQQQTGDFERNQPPGGQPAPASIQADPVFQKRMSNIQGVAAMKGDVAAVNATKELSQLMSQYRSFNDIQDPAVKQRAKALLDQVKPYSGY